MEKKLINHYLQQIAKSGCLSEKEAEELFGNFLTKETSEFDPELATAYLYSTSIRTLTKDELKGAAKVMRKKMLSIDVKETLGDVDILDTCGTGGSGLNPFNTSTAVAFITAAAGIYTAKHGNRAASSQSGSADILEALGVSIAMSKEQFLNCLEKTKFGFLFAPHCHPAAKYVAPLRKKLGTRTIFNFLGPILNPTGANLQLLGVSDAKMQRVMAEVLLELDSKRAMIVRGEDGLDEITLGGKTCIYEIRSGALSSYEISPQDFGFSNCSAEVTKGGSADLSAKLLREILGPDSGCDGKQAIKDLVVLNAGAALYVSERANSIKEGVELAKEILKSGKAIEVLDKVIKLSH